MTKKGILVPGDKLLGLFSKPILAQHPEAKVVFDVKSSSVLPETLKRFGGIPIMSPTGHSIIKSNLQKHKAILAGELSCHFFFNDRYFGYDDGIYAALRLFELILSEQKDLDAMLCVFPPKVSSPEFRLACKNDEEKLKIVTHVTEVFLNRDDAETLTIDGVRAQLKEGWGLVRASNTQTVLSIRFEADSESELTTVKKEFINALLPFYNKQELEQAFDIA